MSSMVRRNFQHLQAEIYFWIIIVIIYLGFSDIFTEIEIERYFTTLEGIKNLSGR